MRVSGASDCPCLRQLCATFVLGTLKNKCTCVNVLQSLVDLSQNFGVGRFSRRYPQRAGTCGVFHTVYLCRNATHIASSVKQPRKPEVASINSNPACSTCFHSSYSSCTIAGFFCRGVQELLAQSLKIHCESKTFRPGISAVVTQKTTRVDLGF